MCETKTAVTIWTRSRFKATSFVSITNKHHKHLQAAEALATGLAATYGNFYYQRLALWLAVAMA